MTPVIAEAIAASVRRAVEALLCETFAATLPAVCTRCGLACVLEAKAQLGAAPAVYLQVVVLQ